MKKTRLTITISPHILSQVDRLIDGHNLRNRSQAIEALVTKQLSGQVTQAVILAGGKADAIDITLTKVAGRPIIRHLINLIKSQSIEHIYILTDQPTDKLEAVVADYAQVQIVKQTADLGTAGSIRHYYHKMLPRPLLVLHADIFTDINLSDLILFHQKQSTKATMGVKPKLNKQEFGKVFIHGNLVTKFLSQPKESGVGMVNTGVYILSPTVIDSIPKKKRVMLETEVFPQLAKEQQLSGFIFEGIWYDVSKSVEAKKVRELEKSNFSGHNRLVSK